MKRGESETPEHLVVARGARVVLREKQPSDAPEDYAWRRDPELARFDGRAPLDEPYSEFVARHAYDLRFGNPREHMLAIDTLDGEHIGNLMYYNASLLSESAEFGITIGRREMQGQGIGREATVLFLRHAWETTAIRTMRLHTFEWNERAIRCFEAAGFEHRGSVSRAGGVLLRMEAQREWWLMDDEAGRFLPVAR
jgi:RimJ/RimL family protein N-acetyltransferase